jgi:hypothetical protein
MIYGFIAVYKMVHKDDLPKNTQKNEDSEDK